MRFVPEGSTPEQSLQDSRVGVRSRQIAAASLNGDGLHAFRGGLVRYSDPQRAVVDPESVKTFNIVDDLFHSFGAKPVNGLPYKMIGQRSGEIGIIQRKPGRRRVT